MTGAGAVRYCGGTLYLFVTQEAVCHAIAQIGSAHTATRMRGKSGLSNVLRSVSVIVRLWSLLAIAPRISHRHNRRMTPKLFG